MGRRRPAPLPPPTASPPDLLPAPDASPPDWRALSAVFLLALALRVLHLLCVKDAYPFFSDFIVDAASYHAWGRRIAAGEWLGKEIFYQDPFYPYFLGVVYRLSGEDTLLVRSIQLLTGSLTCAVIHDTARRLYGRRAAWLAGVMAAAYGVFVFYDATLLKEVFGVFFTAAAVLALVAARGNPRAAAWAAGGVLMGLLALTRGNALFLVPIVVGWIAAAQWTRGPAAARGAVLWWCAGLAVALAPSAARNYVVSRDFVLTTSQAGTNFYIGNNPRATGLYEPLLAGRSTPEYEGMDARRLAEAQEGRALRPSEVSRHWFRRSFGFIRRAPAAWGRLLAFKARLFFSGFEIPDSEDYYLVKRFSWVLRLPLVTFGFVLPLAFVGAAAGVRHPDRALLALVAAGNAVSVVLFYVFARYRLPSVPPLIVLGAGGAAALAAAARAGRSWRGLRLLAVLAGGIALARWGPPEWRRSFLSTSLANLATHHQQNKRLPEAESVLREALALSPDDINARFALGTVFFDGRAFDKAAAEYRSVIASDPAHVEARYLLGVVHFNAGDFPVARAQWEEVLRLYPAHGPAREGLARIPPGR